MFDGILNNPLTIISENVSENFWPLYWSWTLSRVFYRDFADWKNSMKTPKSRMGASTYNEWDSDVRLKILSVVKKNIHEKVTTANKINKCFVDLWPNLAIKQNLVIKKEFPAQVFSLKFGKVFKDLFFYRTPKVAAS